ncbi:MAG TPA: hypothetical protein VFL92_00995 [Sphingomonas sp.]|nr:hypothetical protein [Sphingomonas sp.]
MNDPETRQEAARRRSRLRWITLGEAVAIAAVIISGLGLWNNYEERQQSRAERAADSADRQRAPSPAPFHLKATANAGADTLILAPIDGAQVIQSQTIRFPPSFNLTPVTTTGDARIEAGWFADALKNDRRHRKLAEETQGDERLPVMIETDYLADGKELRSRAYYDIGYALEGHFLSGSSVRLRGLSLIGRAPANASPPAMDAHLGALWEARAGKPKKKD